MTQLTTRGTTRKRRAAAPFRMRKIGGKVTVVRNEHAEQCFLFQWAHMRRRAHPVLRFLHAIPNGGERNGFVAAKLKDEGVKPGVPDLDLPVGRWNHIGLRIELKALDRKTEKQGGCSDSQLDWLEFLAGEGHATAVCYGWRQAADLIDAYLGDDHAALVQLLADHRPPERAPA